MAPTPRPWPALSAIHTLAFDFDGVFTDNKVWVDQDGRESVRCDRGDGLGLDFLRARIRRDGLALDVFILSKERNPVVLARAAKLKLACHQAIGDKLTFMRQHLASTQAPAADPFAGLVYVGNDLNDLPLMRHAGYAVAPSDAHPRVREAAHLVLDQRGGEGFVRAVIEQLLGLDHFSPEELDELVSDC